MAHTSLEVSEKLKEAGYRQDNCYYYWFRGDNKTTPDYRALESSLFNTKYCWAAPTLGELIRELPESFYINGKGEILEFSPFEEEDYRFQSADTPEDAAALAWIELQRAKQEE